MMDDAVATTLATYERQAAKRVQAGLAALDTGRDMARVESFLLRTGRPLPRIVVMGGKLALRCKQIDNAGGHPTGVDGAASAVALAQKLFPEGEFLQGDARSLPVDKNSYDGAWTESVFAHIPRTDVARAMNSVHSALRPGGLLHVRLPLGEGEGFEESVDGRIYRAYWEAAHFEEVMGSLDFTLLQTQPLPEDEVGLVFRREY
jgi:SAM-dependent methyltransferase